MAHHMDSRLYQDAGRPQNSEGLDGPVGIWDLGLCNHTDFSLLQASTHRLRKVVDSILQPYHRNARDLFATIDEELGTTAKEFWTLVLFEHELPLAAHFTQQRKNKDLMKGVAFVLKQGPEDKYYFPCLGGVLLLDKLVAEADNGSDPLMYCIWEAVRNLPSHHRWCIIADSPSETWIEAHSPSYELSKGQSWYGYYYDEPFEWHDDAGLEVVAYAYEDSFNFDEQWTMANERGFIWWPHDFAYRISSQREVLIDGKKSYHVQSASNLVVEGKVSQEEALKAIAALIPELSGTSIPVYDPADGSIQLASTCWVKDANVDWLMRDFGAIAALMIADAERLVEVFAASVRGRPDRSRHPVQGTRIVPDQRLNAREQVFRDTLRFINNWFMPPVLLSAIKQLELLNLTVSWEKFGFSSILPFSDGQLAVLAVACTHHPELGEGCWITLTLPMKGMRVKVLRLANILNIEEYRGASGASLIGGWTAKSVTKESDLSQPYFQSFLPNILYGQGKLEYYVLNMVARARWIEHSRVEIARLLALPMQMPPRRPMLSVADIEQIAKEAGVRMLDPNDPIIKADGAWVEGTLDLSFALSKGILSKPGDKAK